jgi:hypothetical protein
VHLVELALHALEVIREVASRGADMGAKVSRRV